MDKFKIWWETIKNRVETIVKKKPKLFIIISITLILLSFVREILKDFYYGNDDINSSKSLVLISNMYRNSENIKDKNNETIKRKELKSLQITEEIRLLGEKRKKGLLTYNDSLRIDYLINKYKDILDEKEN